MAASEFGMRRVRGFAPRRRPDSSSTRSRGQPVFPTAQKRIRFEEFGSGSRHRLSPAPWALLNEVGPVNHRPGPFQRETSDFFLNLSLNLYTFRACPLKAWPLKARPSVA